MTQFMALAVMLTPTRVNKCFSGNTDRSVITATSHLKNEATKQTADDVD